MTMILSLVLLVAALPLEVETARFNIVKDGMKIGIEEFSISKLEAGYVVRGRTRIETGGRTDEIQSRLELDQELKATLCEFKSADTVIRLTVESSVSELQYGNRTTDVRFPQDVGIIDTNFFHHYLILLQRIGKDPGPTETMVFVPQQMRLGTITVRGAGDGTYELDTENLRLVVLTDEKGRLVRISVPDQRVAVER